LIPTTFCQTSALQTWPACGSRADDQFKPHPEREHPSAQLDPDGSVRSRFVYGTRSTVPDYMLRDGHRFRIVSDDLGSPRLVVERARSLTALSLDAERSSERLAVAPVLGAKCGRARSVVVR
jgi:hypothetical protein